MTSAKTGTSLQPLTAEALTPLLDTVRQKWQRYGAQFLGEAHEVSRSAGCALAQTFVLDDVQYELKLDDQAQLRVQEWVQGSGDEPATLRPVAHPRGLPFPRGLRRVDGYRD